jgi:hypothetical protein
MAPCVRESDVKATPATIWKTCFADMKFEKWDPDVVRLEDVSGECKDGTTLSFIMKEGPIKKVPCKLSDVKENESLRFYGIAMGGAMSFDGLIEITAKDDNTSHIKYTFALNGFLGSMVSWLNPTPIVSGTEGGLANMVKLSEEAQEK